MKQVRGFNVAEEEPAPGKLCFPNQVIGCDVISSASAFLCGHSDQTITHLAQHHVKLTILPIGQDLLGASAHVLDLLDRVTQAADLLDRHLFKAAHRALVNHLREKLRLVILIGIDQIVVFVTLLDLFLIGFELALGQQLLNIRRDIAHGQLARHVSREPGTVVQLTVCQRATQIKLT